MNARSVAGSRKLPHIAKMLVPGFLGLALQGCATHYVFGFDELPDGEPVPSWDASDPEASGITTQYADFTSWGYRRRLEMEPPDGAAFLPRASRDAPSQPNELCLVRFEGSADEPGLILFPTDGLPKVRITVTSGEATLTSIGRSGAEIESRVVGSGRQEFAAKPFSLRKGAISSLSIDGSASDRESFCFDDIEWSESNFPTLTGPMF